MTQLVFLMFLVVAFTSVVFIPGAFSEAARPWFGENNQYKCHCEKNECTPTGQCTPPHRCERGWFGPKCQYADLAVKTNYSPTSWEHIVTDGNEDTCTTEDTGTITITLDKDYPLTLMRFYTKRDGRYSCDLYEGIEISPSDLDPDKCIKRVDPSDFYDIYCPFNWNSMIRRISLYGECSSLLCSVHVSEASPQVATSGDNLPAASSEAARPWFGDNNQYKCHCEKNACTPTGQCTPPHRCVRGWFGPECRYADLAVKTNYSPTSWEHIVTDGNEDTCTTEDTGTITITLDKDYPLTLMRVYTKEDLRYSCNLFEGIRISNLDPDRCTKRVDPSGFYDIYCTNNWDSRIRSISLDGSCTSLLCSVYVSGASLQVATSGDNMPAASPQVTTSGDNLPAASSEAARPWFGDYNQYKCHCEKNACTPTGQCTPPHRCERGWFGPECQYADLAVRTNYSATSLEDIVTDGDDHTCTAEETSSVTITLDKDYPVTWMRFYTKRDRGYSCQLGDEMHLFPSNPKICIQHEDPSGFYDIYFCNNVAVRSISLYGSCTILLCSVYVSGGRNVALRERTRQNGFYTLNSVIYGPDGSVDGDANGNVYPGKTCSHNELNYNSNHLWTVTFTYPVNINRYVIYNRIDNNETKSRIKGYHLETEDKIGRVIFRHVDDQAEAQDVYEFMDGNISQPAAATTIKTFNIDTLNFCEIEIYGDTSCADGFYGRDCKQRCSPNCDGGRCFPSTGACEERCKSGYIGIACQPESPQVAPSGDNLPAASPQVATSGDNLPAASTQVATSGNKMPAEAARPWFGDHSQYKCHCEKNKCTPTGQCPPPHRCERGWFGPECQYADLAGKTNYSPTSWEHIVTDGNEDTCTTEDGRRITITLDKDYTFTSMRFYTKGNETCNLYDDFRMFPSHLDPDVCIKHVDLSGFYDIYCPGNWHFTIRSIELYGPPCVRLLCSVYVSGEPRD